MMLNFIPAVGGYKMGIKAAAQAMKMGEKGVDKVMMAVMGVDKFQKIAGKAGQFCVAQQAGHKAGMTYLADHLIQKGVDLTDREAVHSYVKDNKKAYHEAMMVGTKAMNATFVGAEIVSSIFGPFKVSCSW